MTGSAKNAAMVSGPSACNEAFQRLGHARREFDLGLARLVAAVVMGKFGVLELARTASRNPACMSGFPERLTAAQVLP